jgi:hypothetical protein
VRRRVRRDRDDEIACGFGVLRIRGCMNGVVGIGDEPGL